MLIVWILGLVLLPYCSDGFSIVGGGGSSRAFVVVSRNKNNNKNHYQRLSPELILPYSTCCYAATVGDNYDDEGERKESTTAEDIKFTSDSPKNATTTTTTSDDDINSDEPLQKSERPRFQLQYTCGVCKTRNINWVSYDAYQKGVVIATCKNCSTSHLIADNLGWMKYDRGGFGKSEDNIEDMLKNRKGKKVRRMSMDAWKQLQDLGDEQGKDDSTTTATTTPDTQQQQQEIDEGTLVAGRGRVTKDDEEPPLLPF